MASTAQSKALAAQKSSALDSIVLRASEVIGDKDKALRWLGTPVRALDYATPISLLGTAQGSEAVLTVLTRLEHGIF
ncbi:MAG TPA: MbcA/ParS/Xre antitoxin family protein [Bryobacteraceae bacterium]|jgi:putative toxin-antitoxin system antitoxin component (TIGR02293 family)|nr:MbcA/ParS/Xre antitoxin family protein [Bryobacteraceae bacterium]